MGAPVREVGGTLETGRWGGGGGGGGAWGNGGSGVTEKEETKRQAGGKGFPGWRRL